MPAWYAAAEGLMRRIAEYDDTSRLCQTFQRLIWALSFLVFDEMTDGGWMKGASDRDEPRQRVLARSDVIGSRSAFLRPEQISVLRLTFSPHAPAAKTFVPNYLLIVLSVIAK